MSLEPLSLRFAHRLKKGVQTIPRESLTLSCWLQSTTKTCQLWTKSIPVWINSIWKSSICWGQATFTDISPWVFTTVLWGRWMPSALPSRWRNEAESLYPKKKQSWWWNGNSNLDLSDKDHSLTQWVWTVPCCSSEDFNTQRKSSLEFETHQVNYLLEKKHHHTIIFKGR